MIDLIYLSIYPPTAPHRATSYDRTRCARHHTRAPGRFTHHQGALDMCTRVSASLASLPTAGCTRAPLRNARVRRVSTPKRLPCSRAFVCAVYSRQCTSYDRPIGLGHSWSQSLPLGREAGRGSASAPLHVDRLHHCLFEERVWCHMCAPYILKVGSQANHLARSKRLLW